MQVSPLRTLTGQTFLTLEQANRSDPTWDDLLAPQEILVDIVIHSVLVIVWRTMPASSPNTSRLQCRGGCIDASRLALRKLVAASSLLKQHDTVAWTMSLNV